MCAETRARRIAPMVARKRRGRDTRVSPVSLRRSGVKRALPLQCLQLLVKIVCAGRTLKAAMLIATLVVMGACQPGQIAPQSLGDPAVRKAAQRGLTYLAREAVAWQTKTSCF